jgi:hypothetical protein
MSEVLDTKATKTATEVAAAAPKKRAVVLDPQRMQTAEYVRRDWVCTAEEGTTVDDVLDPSYWVHVSGGLTMYDRIEVRIDSGEYLLELLVKQAGRNWAQVALLHHHDLAGKVTTGEAVTDEFDPLFKGPLRKWCAMRKSDGAVMQDKLESKALALEWISSYERTILAR